MEALALEEEVAEPEAGAAVAGGDVVTMGARIPIVVSSFTYCIII